MGEPAYRQRVYKNYRATTVVANSGSNPSELSGKVRQYHKRWAQFLPKNKNSSILDLGCGGGEFLYYLQQEGFNNLHGVDTSPDQVSVANELGMNNVVVGEAREYLVSCSNDFDLIAAFNLLEHLTRDEMFVLLDEVVKVLRPGGLFLAEIPNSKSLFSARVRYADITHEQSFTPKSIIQIYSLVGLKPLSIMERGPVVHGFKSGLRWMLWQIIRGIILLYLIAEMADTRWRVYTQDMRVVAKKPEI